MDKTLLLILPHLVVPWCDKAAHYFYIAVVNLSVKSILQYHCITILQIRSPAWSCLIQSLNFAIVAILDREFSDLFPWSFEELLEIVRTRSHCLQSVDERSFPDSRNKLPPKVYGPLSPFQ